MCLPDGLAERKMEGSFLEVAQAVKQGPTYVTGSAAIHSRTWACCFIQIGISSMQMGTTTARPVRPVPQWGLPIPATPDRDVRTLCTLLVQLLAAGHSAALCLIWLALLR